MDAWNILVVVVLALILLLILPMVAARNGTKSFTQALMAPLHRKKKRGPLGLEVEPEKKPERHVNNSMQGELTSIVSQLITFTKRQHYTLVYPGTIREGGELTTTLALVVTPGGVVGLNCFGFAGQIDPGEKPTDQWRQHINHQDNRIPTPILASEKQQVLLRRAMDKAGLSGIPVEVITVFTNKEARLSGVSEQKCFDRDGMIAYLEQERFHSGPVDDTHETGVKLKSLVIVYKSDKQKKKKK